MHLICFHFISSAYKNRLMEMHQQADPRNAAAILSDSDPRPRPSTCGSPALQVSGRRQTHPTQQQAGIGITCGSLHKRAQSSHYSEEAMNATSPRCSASSQSTSLGGKKGIKLGKNMVASVCLVTAAFATIVLFCLALLN